MTTIIPRRCVVCGCQIDNRTVDVRYKYPAPAACTAHADDVQHQLRQRASMWPADWYGHWSKRGRYWEPMADKRLDKEV